MVPLSEPVFSSKNSLSPQPTWGVPLITPAAQQQNAASVGYDGGRGIKGVGMGDCLDSPANGVTIAIKSRDPLMTPTVAQDAGSDAWPTSVTNARAFFCNVPEGSFTLTATLPGGKQVSQTAVSTAGGTITAVQMHPTP